MKVEISVPDLTEFLQQKLVKMLHAQAYSGTSHTTFGMGYTKQPDWVSMEEIEQYFPSLVKEAVQEYMKRGA